MKISVIGTGYVGLITGIAFAKKGYKVTGWDLNDNIISSTNSGKPVFYEDNLEEELKNVLKTKNFYCKNINQFSLCDETELIFIAVGTPSKENGDIDLSYIFSSFEIIGRAISKRKIFKHYSIVVKSTVIPGTTLKHGKEIIEKYSGLSFEKSEFGLGMNPEFLREGSAIFDAFNPDRIVIGTEDKLTKERMRKLYSSFDSEKYFCNTATAEFSKYANNIFLALQISMSNELANIASKINEVKIKQALEIIKLDSRWKNTGSDNTTIRDYILPGPGFGGSCFPKDVAAMANLGTNVSSQTLLIDGILEVNRKQPILSLYPIEDWLLGKNQKILLLGYSFKPGTDDIRETPSRTIGNYLIKEGHQISIHDPLVENSKILNDFPESKPFVSKDIDNLIENNDVIIVVTPWQIYKEYSTQNKFLKKKIYDVRGALNPKLFIKNNYRSFSNN